METYTTKKHAIAPRDTATFRPRAQWRALYSEMAQTPGKVSAAGVKGSRGFSPGALSIVLLVALSGDDGVTDLGCWWCMLGHPSWRAIRGALEMKPDSLLLRHKLNSDQIPKAIGNQIWSAMREPARFKYLSIGLLVLLWLRCSF